MEEKRKSAAVIPARHNASVRSRALGSIPALLESLVSVKADERRAALAGTVRAFEEGSVARPQETGWANTLARTFFSFSQEGFSPERIVWEAVIRGLSVVGCCDTDTLSALPGAMGAGDALGIRVTVSMESCARAASCDDSGETGIVRAMGVGFAEIPPPGSDHGTFLRSLHDRARERGKAMIAELNSKLSPVAVDFENDIAPLTPSGIAGIGHIAGALVVKAALAFPNTGDRAVFWGDVLSLAPQEVERLWGVPDEFLTIVRDRVGRMAPDVPPREYPAAEDLFRAFEASGAVPCVLRDKRNGRSGSAADAGRFLDDAINRGARAVALEPDASWNIADPAEKERSLAALGDFMAAAKKRSLPVLAGSFMDAPCRKFVDSFGAPELAPYVRDFADAAFWLYGHTTLQRAIGAGLASEWAYRQFGAEHEAANSFYAEAGRKAPPGKAARARIREAGADARPGDILNALVET